MTDAAPPSGQQRPAGEGSSQAASGRLIVRGGLLRSTGYVVGAVANLLGSMLLLRHLGVEDFGRYAAVTSLVAIVGGLAEGGLTAVGNREMALMDRAEDRRALMSRLLGLRLVITPLAVAGGVVFALGASYSPELILGTVLAGVGWTLVAASASLALPLSVDLRIPALTSLDLVKQVGASLTVVALVAAGTGLVPFFGAAIPAALIAIAMTPLLVPRGTLAPPTFRLAPLWTLLRRSLPIAIATVIAAVYLRFMTVVVFQFSDETQTGLFGTSARVLEALLGVPLFAFLVALPVLSRAHRDNPEQLRALFRRMAQVGNLGAFLLVTLLVLGASAIVEVVGGPGYADAAPILQIQSLSLVGALLGMAATMAAIAMGRDRAILTANAVALVTGLAIGIPATMAWGAMGGAISTVVGDTLLGLTFLWLISRGNREILPGLMAMLKPAFASALGVLAGVLSGLASPWATALGALTFAVTCLLTRAVPPEVLDALRRR